MPDHDRVEPEASQENTPSTNLPLDSSEPILEGEIASNTGGAEGIDSPAGLGADSHSQAVALLDTHSVQVDGAVVAPQPDGAAAPPQDGAPPAPVSPVVGATVQATQ